MHSAKDGFVVNAEYLGRGLFSKADMVEEEQTKRVVMECRRELGNVGRNNV